MSCCRLLTKLVPRRAVAILLAAAAAATAGCADGTHRLRGGEAPRLSVNKAEDDKVRQSALNDPFPDATRIGRTAKAAQSDSE